MPIQEGSTPAESLQEVLEVDRVEPAHFIVGGPQLAGLVDVNLASLLSVRLAKLLVDPQSVQPRFEDPSFAAKIGGTAQAQGRCEIQLGFVEFSAVGVVGKIQQIAAGPVRLQRLGVAKGQSRGGWRIIRQSVVVHIFRTLGSRSPRLRCGGSALGGIGKEPRLGRCLGSAFGPRAGSGRQGSRGGFDRSLRRLDGGTGSDVDQRGCLRARFGTDPFGSPILLLRLLARSLHVGSRITVVHAANVGDAGQGEQVFFPRGSVHLLVELCHVHRHVFGDNLLWHHVRRLWREQRLIDRDLGVVRGGGIKDRISGGVGTFVLASPISDGISVVLLLEPRRNGWRW